MKFKNMLNTLLYFGAIGVSICLLFFVVTCTWIGYEVKNECRRAKNQYATKLPVDQQDCVTALAATLNDESQSFATRNSAIWALGQLGDERALSTLQKFYTGNIPDREPLNSTISQYELKKAINLASGGTNLSALFWRYDNQL